MFVQYLFGMPFDSIKYTAAVSSHNTLYPVDRVFRMVTAPDHRTDGVGDVLLVLVLLVE